MSVYYVGGGDADEAKLVRLALRFAFGDNGVEAVENLARQEIAQRIAVPSRIGRHNRFIGGLGALQERACVERRVRLGNFSQRFQRTAVLRQWSQAFVY